MDLLTPGAAPPDSASIEALHRQMTELRASFARAVATARTDLAEAEDAQWRLQQELNLVNSSVGRRTILDAHRRVTLLLNILRHPLWTIGWIGGWLSNRRAFREIRAAWRRATTGESLVRFLPMLDQQTDMPRLGDALRWIGPVRIGGETLQSLLCHPSSSVTFRLNASPGARVVCRCNLVPQIWHQNFGGVQFDLKATLERTGWTSQRTVRLDPNRRWKDRRWRTLVLPVPIASSEEITVTLSTRLPLDATGAHAWAIWGEPRIEWRRSAGDMVRSARSLASRVRTAGMATTVRQLRALETSDQLAMLYRRWADVHSPSPARLQAMAAESASLPYQPLISVITPVYNTDPKWLRACIESVRRQAYPNWELCLCDDASPSRETIELLREYEQDPRIRVRYLTTNVGISMASNAALELAQGDFIALLDHDDELAPEALFEVARFLGEHRDADMVYSDEDKLDVDGARCDPYFKPDWSPEHFLACMYTCHLMVLRRPLVQQVGGFRAGYEGAQDYDLMLRVMERTRSIHHIPRMLYRWRKVPQSAASVADAKPWALDAGRRAIEDYVRRETMKADVLPGGAPGLFRIRHHVDRDPLVSIIIPTTGRPRHAGGRDIDLLAKCVSSVAHKTSYANYEILIIADEGRVPESTHKALQAVRHRCIPYHSPGPFNFSHKINFGASHAAGSHWVLFNDDMEVMSSEWLLAMLEYSQQPEIGAVGAKLFYPDGRLQHVGLLIGVRGIAAHAFHQHPGSSTGYSSSTIRVGNFSAVTAACMMTRRDVFNEIGGFNEELSVDFNDVDYCLRLRQAGYRIVFTPYAQLYHHESASFGPRLQNPREMARMRELWGATLDRDPYYNPNLSTEFPDYRLNSP